MARAASVQVFAGAMIAGYLGTEADNNHKARASHVTGSILMESFALKSH